jgi:hypothetical protein
MAPQRNADRLQRFLPAFERSDPLGMFVEPGLYL